MILTKAGCRFCGRPFSGVGTVAFFLDCGRLELQLMVNRAADPTWILCWLNSMVTASLRRNEFPRMTSSWKFGATMTGIVNGVFSKDIWMSIGPYAINLLFLTAAWNSYGFPNGKSSTILRDTKLWDDPVSINAKYCVPLIVTGILGSLMQSEVTCRHESPTGGRLLTRACCRFPLADGMVLVVGFLGMVMLLVAHVYCLSLAVGTILVVAGF